MDLLNEVSVVVVNIGVDDAHTFIPVRLGDTACEIAIFVVIVGYVAKHSIKDGLADQFTFVVILVLVIVAGTVVASEDFLDQITVCIVYPFGEDCIIVAFVIDLEHFGYAILRIVLIRPSVGASVRELENIIG